MSAEEISLSSQLVFQDDPLRFNCRPPQHRVGGGDPGPKTTTRELTGFIDDKLFSSSSNSATGTRNERYFSSHQGGGAEFPRNMYRENRNWSENGNGSSGDESDGDDDDDDDDDVDDDDGGDGDRDNTEVQGLVSVDNAINNTNNGNSDKSNNINNSTAATANNTSNIENSGDLDKMGSNGKPKHYSFGTSGEIVALKDAGETENNTVTIAEPDGEMYYSPYLQGAEGSGSGAKDMGVENGCVFSGRKEVSSFSSDSGESLRAILSDPITGSLMDDAMILPCGHSFGTGGVQHIIRTKACYTCQQSVSEDSIAPNFSLRAAVQAFRREEELQFYRISKKRRERLDQDRGCFSDSIAMDGLRARGVQFPFAVTDRVIIKGNKRTPQRFVGREAVVTTQCLNGWYVVKTLDNAESVKLQYRSLAKVSQDSSSKNMSGKMATNWL